MQGKMNLLCSFKGSPDDPEHHAPYLHLMQALRLARPELPFLALVCHVDANTHACFAEVVGCRLY